MSRRAYCETGTSQHCWGSAGSAEDDTVRTCYRCGLDTCTACSSIQPGTVVGRVPGSDRVRLVTRAIRMCDNCLEHEPDGPARVRLRRYHEAGYPERTLDECRTEIIAQTALAERLTVRRVTAPARVPAGPRPVRARSVQ